MAVTFGTGPGGQLFCAFIEGLEELLETEFTPELLGLEQGFDQEISTYFPESMFSPPFWGASPDWN